MNRLTGKVALITGAGSGFGREAALLFASEGASVAVADLDEAGGSDTASQIASQGGRAIFIRADLSHPEQVKAMVEEATDTFGRLDVLFNNAGVAMEQTPVTEITEHQYAHIMDVNFKGVLFGCRYGVPAIEKSTAGEGGSIINMASMAALKGRPNLSIYCASKGAVVALTKSLAVELASRKIRVNAICPVATDTPMLPRFLPKGAPVSVDALKQAAAAQIPMGRLGRALDTAHLAVFLASGESEFLTGLAIPVDGGYSA